MTTSRTRALTVLAALLSDEQIRLIGEAFPVTITESAISEARQVREDLQIRVPFGALVEKMPAESACRTIKTLVVMSIFHSSQSVPRAQLADILVRMYKILPLEAREIAEAAWRKHENRGIVAFVDGASKAAYGLQNLDGPKVMEGLDEAAKGWALGAGAAVQQSDFSVWPVPNMFVFAEVARQLGWSAASDRLSTFTGAPASAKDRSTFAEVLRKEGYHITTEDERFIPLSVTPQGIPKATMPMNWLSMDAVMRRAFTAPKALAAVAPAISSLSLQANFLLLTPQQDVWTAIPTIEALLKEMDAPRFERTVADDFWEEVKRLRGINTVNTEKGGAPEKGFIPLIAAGASLLGGGGGLLGMLGGGGGGILNLFSSLASGLIGGGTEEDAAAATQMASSATPQDINRLSGQAKSAPQKKGSGLLGGLMPAVQGIRKHIHGRIGGLLGMFGGGGKKKKGGGGLLGGLLGMGGPAEKEIQGIFDQFKAFAETGGPRLSDAMATIYRNVEALDLEGQLADARAEAEAAEGGGPEDEIDIISKAASPLHG